MGALMITALLSTSRLCTAQAQSPAPADPEATDAAAPADPTGAKCAYQRKEHPDYILWVCNPEGTAPSSEASLLWVRTNAAGAEVLTSVWHGAASELVRRADDIISTHKKSHERCQRYVHLARADGRRMTWNVGTQGMLSGWDRMSASGAGRLCYAAEPGSADFVIVWSDGNRRLPNAFTVQVPSTSDDRDSPVPRSTGRPARAARGTPADLAVAVYRVDPGMDNSILRLGLSLFNAPAAAASPTARASAFDDALRYVRTLP
jgi:hypothetical protein